MQSLEDRLSQATRALVIGMGGGGDVVGTIPTAALLAQCGIEPVIGGVAWERVKHDPQPGPRALSELEDVTRINDTVAWSGPDCGVPDGCRFASGLVARALGERTVIVDVTRGAAGLAAGLRDACEQEGFDLLVMTDSGGDALVLGPGTGVKSPVCDAIGLQAAAASGVPSLLGVLGWGSDGELSLDELEASVSTLSKRGALLGAWGVTHKAAERMERACALVPTEASRVPVEAFRGLRGDRPIRDGTRGVPVTTAAAVTYYFDLGVVADAVPWRDAVRATTTLDDANAVIVGHGLPSELDFERRYAAAGHASYQDAARSS